MAITTCDLCDKYGDRARVLPAGFRHFGGKRSFRGAVVTVRCPEDNSKLKELASTAGAGQVLVVDGGGSVRYALLGDMVGALLLEHGWAGVVVFGAVRDSVALAALGLGVMALGTAPRRSLKNGEGQVGVVVEMAGLKCATGEMLVADEDGVVLIDAGLLTDEEKR